MTTEPYHGLLRLLTSPLGKIHFSKKWLDVLFCHCLLLGQALRIEPSNSLPNATSKCIGKNGCSGEVSSGCKRLQGGNGVSLPYQPARERDLLLLTLSGTAQLTSTELGATVHADLHFSCLLQRTQLTCSFCSTNTQLAPSAGSVWIAGV